MTDNSGSMLDMSLDEVIAKNPKQNNSPDMRRRRRFRSAGPPDRRWNTSRDYGGRDMDWTPTNRQIQKPRFDRRQEWAPYDRPQTRGSRDFGRPPVRVISFDDRRRAHSAGGGSSRTVLVSGLEWSVLKEDLEELFTSVGPIQRCWINYDNTDRSKGTGGGVFMDPSDARRAVELFDGRKIDEKPIRLELSDGLGFGGNDRFENRGPMRRGGRRGGW